MRRLARVARGALGNRELWLVAGITLLAACLRFHNLDRWPPGLYHDEAYNGLDALRVLQGERPVYFEANNGREPLFIYLVAATVGALGPSPGAIRLAAAILGTLTVPFTYLMAKALFGQRVGLLAAALMAITFWPLNLSRLGLRAVAMPPVTALAIWSLIRAARRGRWYHWAAAGALVGLGLYTYLAFRMTAIAWLGILAYLLWARRPRASWRSVALFLLAAAAIAMPLLAYALAHPEALVQRAGQLGIWSPEIGGDHPWQALWRQVARTGLMFVYRGDFIPRHNLPLRPVFDPLMAIFFVVGVVWCLAKWKRQPACALALGWTGLMCLPTILAEGAPHFLRAVGVLPVAMLFPALGLDLAARWLAERRVGGARWGLAAILAISGAWTCRDYVRHVGSEAAYYNFEAGAAELAAEMNRFLDQGWDGSGLYVETGLESPASQVFLDRRLWEGWASIRFLTPPDRLATWSPEALPVPDPSLPEVMLVCWPYADYGPALALLPRHAMIHARAGARERGDLEAESRLLHVSFTARATQDAPRNLHRRFDQGISLLGYEYTLVQPTSLNLRLYWQAQEDMTESWTVFVHVRRDGGMNGQSDAPPGQGYYPTHRWRAGDVIVDEHVIDLAHPFAPGRDEVWVGMYRDQERLPVLDDSGATMGDHVALHLGQ